MKTFSTSGTGNQQTLSEIESDKVPVYNTEADAVADLSNLEENQIGITKDTGTELSQPVNAVESGNLHAVTSNAVAESLSYSETEQATGGKWIDGKPIYKKTIDCGALPNNTTKNVAHNIANLDEVIELSGSARRSEGTRLPLPFTSADSLSNNIQVYSNDTNIVIIAGTNRSNYTGYVTLEYTKTTD